MLAAAGLWLACICSPGMAAALEQPPSWHFFSGAELTQRSTFFHQGLIWSPRGDLHSPGWRLRGLTDGGAYRYRSDGMTTAGRILGLELMPGYSWFTDRHGLTLYLGGTLSEHRTRPHDAAKPRQGGRYGAKILAEGWFRISEFVTVDASAGFESASRSYAARLAATFGLAKRLVLEPEIAAFGEPGYDQQRVGLLVELYRAPQLRVLGGGGWSRDRDGSGTYLSIQLKSWR